MENLEELACAAEPIPAGAWWISLQCTEHILGAPAQRDPHTGETLPQSLRELLVAIDTDLAGAQRPLPVDRLMQAVELSAAPLQEILERHRTRLVREHRQVPFHRLREVDSTSVAWLARQPGRTVREKLAGRHSMLGVVRRFTPDTAENRLVVSLAALLGQRADARVLVAREHAAYDDGPADLRRRDLLETVVLLSGERLRRSALAGVPATTRPRPNNALLSDPLYSRLWRAFKWLRAHQEDVETMWLRLRERLQVTFFWMLAARLAASRDAAALDGLVRITPGYQDSPFGIACLQASGAERAQWTAPGDLTLPLWLRSPPDELLELQLSSSGEELTLAVSRFSGKGIRSATFVGTIRYELGFADNPLAWRRGMPLSVSRRTAAGKSLAAWTDFADVGGLTALADAVADDMLTLCRARSTPRAASVARVGSAASPPDTPRYLGIDPAAPHLVLFETTKAWVPTAQGWAACFVLDDERREWIQGDALRRVPLDGTNPALYSLSAVLDPDQRDDHRLLQSASHRIVIALAQELQLAPGAHVAYAVPDCTDESSQKTLRSAMTLAFARARPVWRSVAAAMGWQRSAMHGDVPFAAADIKFGDPVLVLDAEVPVLTTTMLIARQDGKLAKLLPETRGIYWERRPSLPRNERDEAMAWPSLLEEYARTLVKTALQGEPKLLAPEQQRRLATNLVRSGRIQKLLNDGAQPLQLQLSEHDKIILEIHPDPKRWSQLIAGWTQQLGYAAEEIAKLLRGGKFGRRAHLLLVGRAFHHQAKLLRPKFEDLFAKAGCGAVRIAALDREVVADGSQHCLQRLNAGCRTWSEWLPELYLEVLRDGHFADLSLVKEHCIDDPFLGSAVHVAVPGKLILPAGQPFFALPLVTGRASHEPLAIEARLESPHFPLTEPCAVKLQVSYRYGLDASYELACAPDQPDQAAFGSLVARSRQLGSEKNRGAYVAHEPVFDSADPDNTELQPEAPAGEVDAAITQLRQVQEEFQKAAYDFEQVKEPFKQAVRRLGNLAGDGRNERGRALELLLSVLREYRNRENFHPSAASQTTRVLVRALWHHPRLVHRLGTETVQFLTTAAQRSLENLVFCVPTSIRQLGKPEDRDRLRFVYGLPFQDACALLLALLRLRGRPELSWLRGGEPFGKLLARQVRRLDNLFVRAGVNLRWDGPSQALLDRVPQVVKRMSPIAWTLNVLLLGDDAIRLVEAEIDKTQ